MGRHPEDMNRIPRVTIIHRPENSKWIPHAAKNLRPEDTNWIPRVECSLHPENRTRILRFEFSPQPESPAHREILTKLSIMIAVRLGPPAQATKLTQTAQRKFFTCRQKISKGLLETYRKP